MKDDINLYGYVGNNPVMFGDPMGLAAKAMIAGLNSEERFNMMHSFLYSKGYSESLDKGNSNAIDALWSYASYLSNDDINMTLSTMYHTVHVSPVYGENSEQNIHRITKLPSGLNGDYTTSFGDTDKLQHFFASAIISYNTSSSSPDSNIGGGAVLTLGTLHEVSDQFVASFANLIGKENNGGFDKDDIRANNLGAEFGRQLKLTDGNSTPSYFSKLY